jgi:hypothetical protein
VHQSATESDEPSRRKFKYSVAEGLKSGPVLNATNTGQPMYLRTYIAEVVLCYANGSLLELYKAKRRMLMQVSVRSFGRTSRRDVLTSVAAVRALLASNRC